MADYLDTPYNYDVGTIDGVDTLTPEQQALLDKQNSDQGGFTADYLRKSDALPVAAPPVSIELLPATSASPYLATPSDNAIAIPVSDPPKPAITLGGIGGEGSLRISDQPVTQPAVTDTPPALAALDPAAKPDTEPDTEPEEQSTGNKFLGYLGQGLRIIGGGLSKSVYEANAEQDRQKAAQKIKAQEEVAARKEKTLDQMQTAIETGAVTDPAKLASMQKYLISNGRADIAPNAAALHQQQLVQNEIQTRQEKQAEDQKTIGFAKAVSEIKAKKLSPDQELNEIRKVAPKHIADKIDEQMFAPKADATSIVVTPTGEVMVVDKVKGTAKDVNIKARASSGSGATATPESVDASAEALKTGLPVSPRGGLQAAAEAKLIQQYAGKFTPAEVLSKVADAKNNNAALAKLIPNTALLRSFENTALSNLQFIDDEIAAVRAKQKVADAPFFNNLANKWNEMTGQARSEGLGIYGKAASGELAKLASSATASGTGGTLTDREGWEGIFANTKSLEQMEKSVKSSRNEIAARIKGANDAIKISENQKRDLWLTPEEKKSETKDAIVKSHKNNTEQKDHSHLWN